MRFKTLALSDLHIEDERALRHVGLYDELKQALRRDGYKFRVPERGKTERGKTERGDAASWDRVAFLNLTFWDGAEQGDVLRAPAIPADVVCHAAWHHLGRRALAKAGAGNGADAMFLGEAIASAFDVYLIGRLLGHAPDAQFLETQVPAMADVAEAAGLGEEGFEALIAEISADPERAFEDLRQLLFDVGTSLTTCAGVDAAAAALERFDGHRFMPLLHHFEMSNWILYARAYAPAALAPDPAVRAIDAALRAAPVSLDWLEREWVEGAAKGA